MVRQQMDDQTIPIKDAKMVIDWMMNQLRLLEQAKIDDVRRQNAKDAIYQQAREKFFEEIHKAWTDGREEWDLTVMDADQYIKKTYHPDRSVRKVNGGDGAELCPTCRKIISEPNMCDCRATIQQPVQ